MLGQWKATKQDLHQSTSKVRQWTIWDSKEKMFVTRFIEDPAEQNPRRRFGGPWHWDTERFHFIPMDIFDTLERLDLI